MAENINHITVTMCLLFDLIIVSLTFNGGHGEFKERFLFELERNWLSDCKHVIHEEEKKLLHQRFRIDRVKRGPATEIYMYMYRKLNRELLIALRYC